MVYGFAHEKDKRDFFSELAGVCSDQSIHILITVAIMTLLILSLMPMS